MRKKTVNLNSAFDLQKSRTFIPKLGSTRTKTAAQRNVHRPRVSLLREEPASEQRCLENSWIGKNLFLSPVCRPLKFSRVDPSLCDSEAAPGLDMCIYRRRSRYWVTRACNTLTYARDGRVLYGTTMLYGYCSECNLIILASAEARNFRCCGRFYCFFDWLASNCFSGDIIIATS